MNQITKFRQRYNLSPEQTPSPAESDPKLRFDLAERALAAEIASLDIVQKEAPRPPRAWTPERSPIEALRSIGIRI